MIRDKIEQIKSKVESLKGQRGILTKVQVFQFQPFSKKQKQILTWWTPSSSVKDYDGIIADGSDSFRQNGVYVPVLCDVGHERL